MNINKILVVLLPIILISTTFAALPNKCGTIEALEAFRQGVRLARNTSQKIMSSTHFVIHYDTIGTHAVNNAYAESVKKYAEYSWAKQVDTLKWASPPPDGGSGGSNPNNLYDIYIRSLGNALGVTYSESFYTSPYPDGVTSYLKVDNTIPSSYGWGVLQVTVAHEFNHACQYRYSYLEDNFWYENTATWMEDMCYDNVNDYVSYLSSNPNPLDSPYLAITTSTNLYWYAGAVWAMFLEEFYNDSCPRFSWERMGSVSGENTLSGLDYILTNKFSSTLMTALKKYAVWRYFTGTRADAYHFSEASTWPTSTVLRTHTTYPASGNESPNSPSGPGGTDFIRFTSGTNALSAIFDGQDGNNWAAYLVGYRNPFQSVEQEFTLNSVYCDTQVMSWTGNSAIVLIPVVTQWASAADNKTFTYNASQTTTSSNKDVGVTAIESPTRSIDSTSSVIPRARVRNYKSDSTTFNVTFKIGTWSSSRTKKLNGLSEDTVNFSAWIPVRGTFITRCSTYLLNDTNKLNDTLSGSVTINVTDVGVAKIIAPTGTFDSLTSVTPVCSVYNYGTTTQTYLVRMKVGSFYNDTVRVVSQASGGKDYIEFTPYSNWPRGTHTVSCSTELATDAKPSNDKKTLTITITVVIPAPWTILRNIPIRSNYKYVKSGGSLVACNGGIIYGLKGNNTREFYAYDISDDTWILKESIPDDPINRKRVYKGAALAYNKFTNPGIIYALKGNNTLEFWSYDLENDSWFVKPPVPYNPIIIKKVKGGAGLAFVKRDSNHYVYLLKGNRTNEFYAFHCQGDSWIKSLKPAPLGPDLKPYKEGSCLAVGPNDRLYLLKGGAKYNEFYFYEISQDTWGVLESIPRYSYLTGKKTKVKDGASICYSGDSLMYVFKGGNKQEFWQYNINQNRWMELDTIPTRPIRKKVSSGGALAFMDNKVYALKGNKTLEFWCYNPTVVKSEERIANSNCAEQDVSHANSKVCPTISVVPNLLTKNSVIELNLNQKTKVKIMLYNSIGQLRKIILDKECPASNYSISLDRETLVSGIYYLKCDIGNSTQTLRIIVQ